MFEDKTDRLWVSALKSGTYLYDRSAEQTDGEIVTNFLSKDRVKNDDGLRLNSINCILEDRTGNIWFAAWRSEGISRYDGKSLRQFSLGQKTKKQGIANLMFRSILEDKNGKIWFGTQYDGLFRYDPAKDEGRGKSVPRGQASFIDVTQNTGLSHSCIYSILEDRNGNIWLCTENEGVWRYDGKSFKNFTTEDGLINNSVYCVVEDKEGNLWFGTANVGLCRYDGKSFVHFSE